MPPAPHPPPAAGPGVRVRCGAAFFPDGHRVVDRRQHASLLRVAGEGCRSRHVSPLRRANPAKPILYSLFVRLFARGLGPPARKHGLFVGLRQHSGDADRCGAVRMGLCRLHFCLQPGRRGPAQFSGRPAGLPAGHRDLSLPRGLRGDRRTHGGVCRPLLSSPG